MFSSPFLTTMASNVSNPEDVSKTKTLISVICFVIVDNHIRRTPQFREDGTTTVVGTWKDGIALSKLQFQRLFKGMKIVSEKYKEAGFQRQVMELDDEKSQLSKGKLAIVMERVKGETSIKIAVTYRTKNGITPRFALTIEDHENFADDIVTAQIGKGRIDLTPVQFRRLYLLRDSIMHEIVKREGNELPPRMLGVDCHGTWAQSDPKDKDVRQRIGIQNVVMGALMGLLEDRNKNIYKSTDLAKDVKEGIKTIPNADVMKRIYSHYSSSIRHHNPTYQQLCTFVHNVHTAAGGKRLIQFAKQRLADMPNLAGGGQVEQPAMVAAKEVKKSNRKRPVKKQLSTGNTFV